MSELHACVRCGAEWETGWGADADDLCRECKRVDERLAKGGHGLTGQERAAVAEFLGFELDDEHGAFPVEGRMNGMVWGPEEEGGFKDFDAVEPINAFTPEAI